MRWKDNAKRCENAIFVSARGLSCIINNQGIMQSPVVRAEAGIPEDQVIQTCIAMDWPDESFPANAVMSQRKSVDEAVTFLGLGTEPDGGRAI